MVINAKGEIELWKATQADDKAYHHTSNNFLKISLVGLLEIEYLASLD